MIFEAVEAPERHLARLYGRAWSAAEVPLLFLPDSSREFAGKVEKDPGQAWRAANTEFHGSGGGDWSKPESERTLETLRLWEGRSPVSPLPLLPGLASFDTLASEIFGPLLAARRTELG